MWHLKFTAERGKATRTFVCTVPVCRHRVTTEKRKRRERLGAGPAIGLAVRTRAKWALPASDFVGVVRGQCGSTCVFRPRQLSPFYPVTSRTLFWSWSPGTLLSDHPWYNTVLENVT